MIYLDHNATTVVHNKVKSLMIDLISYPINASSIHYNGRFGRHLIEKARMQVINCLQAKHDVQVIFTASGTEANNIVMFNFKDFDIFISAGEHSSIFEYKKYNCNIQVIELNFDGTVNLDHLYELLKKSQNIKKIVSVMIANNETGIIQPIIDISKIAKYFGALMHSDCIQAIGKIDVNMSNLGLDLVTISGHKFGAPIGAAALVVVNELMLHPMIIGGGQEKGMRSGTENFYAISCLGLASEIAYNELQKRNLHMFKLRQRLEQSLLNVIPDIKIVGVDSNRLPNTSLIINTLFNSDTQMIALDMNGIQVSSGSACSSGKVMKSRSLSAMNFEQKDIESVIRVSIGYDQDINDIDKFVDVYINLCKNRMSLK